MNELTVTPVEISPKEWGIPNARKLAQRGSVPKYALSAILVCPIHREVTPSFYIEVHSHDDEPAMTSGVFECLGCGVKGTTIPSKDSEPLVGETGIASADIWDLIYKPVQE